MNDDTLLTRWFHGLSFLNRRKAERRALSGLVAYYWEGGVSVGHEVREISSTGMYLLTDQRWYPGTMMMMTLQRTGGAEGDPECSIAVRAKVIRLGADGVALAFALPAPDRPSPNGQYKQSDGADRKDFDRFMKLIKVNQV